MILLDSDVLIDLLRKYPPAAGWFDSLHAVAHPAATPEPCVRAFPSHGSSDEGLLS